MRSVSDETKYESWTHVEEQTWEQIDKKIVEEAEEHLRDAVEFPALMMVWNQVWTATWKSTAGLAL